MAEPTQPIKKAPARMLHNAGGPPRKPKKVAVIERDSCTGCDICVQFCPIDECIVKVPDNEGWQLNGYDFVVQEKCIGCQLCVKECPWEAITMEERIAVANPIPVPS